MADLNVVLMFFVIKFLIIKIILLLFMLPSIYCFGFHLLMLIINKYTLKKFYEEFIENNYFLMIHYKTI